MERATPQRTVLSRSDDPTPMMAELMTWVVLTGMPKCVAPKMTVAAVVSAGYMAFSHGSNDAQKTMGIMTLALLVAGVIPEFVVPFWVKVAAATAISLGTAGGGWRIIKTMGTKVVKLDPVHGFAAETTAASIIFGASQFGMPVSTTHVISSAIMGVGSTGRLSAVRWGVARTIVTAWVLTLPAAGLTAPIAYLILSPILR